MKRILWVLLMFLPTAGFADHRAPLGQGTPGTPSSSLKVTGEVTSYEIGFERGMWTAMAFHGAVAPLDWWGLQATIPVVRVMPDGGASAVGIADINVGSNVLLGDAQRDDIWILFGLGVTAPTGSEHDRIGSGHTEVIPSVQVTSKLDSALFLNGLLSHSASFSGSHDHDGHDHPAGFDVAHSHDLGAGEGSLYEPHYAQELTGRIGLNGVHLNGQWEVFLSGGLGFAEELHIAPVESGFWGSVQVTPSASFFTGPTFSLGGETRFPWKWITGLAWNFSSKEEERVPESCGCSP